MDDSALVLSSPQVVIVPLVSPVKHIWFPWQVGLMNFFPFIFSMPVHISSEKYLILGTLIKSNSGIY